MLALGTAAGQAGTPPKSAGAPAVGLPALQTTEPLADDAPKDDALRKFLKARYNAALAEA